MDSSVKTVDAWVEAGGTAGDLYSDLDYVADGYVEGEQGIS